MPGLAQRNEQFSSSSLGFWSRNTDEVSFNQLQKFWGELSPLARQELVRIDKQTLFEQARKNLYCSRCNGLLLEGFMQIITYGKSLQQDGTAGNLLFNRVGVRKNQSDGMLAIPNGCCDESQDPSVHPWGGLTTTRDGLLTLMDYYLFSKSLKGVQNVFDSGRARERERELLYPDACGGGGRGWISQGMVSYGRGHGTRESCALHTARLSCDTLVDFWSALGEETRQSLLRMKEDDFIERLMYRFDSKRFCRDCRRNVIREFKELKELKRLRREPRCTTWFCGADTTFQYEVTSDSVQVDWHQTFAENVGTYHHFEWAIGTGEGKSDILEFENVGLNGGVQVNGLDLNGLSACYITLRAFKTDGRCSELSVKAHALNGQQCVHCRLVVGDGFVSITRGENIRLFFEHAEETEEEEDDDSMDKDGSEVDGECSRPQKHAKSPELAREFLLDAATVIFKEQVEKAFREGTARQNAHSIFVCLALKQLEERVHVACKEIITLERQTKLLEEEEKEKRDEEKKKERRRTKEREKKLRRKERLKGKDKEKEKHPLTDDVLALPHVSKELSPNIDLELSNDTSSKDMDDPVPSMPRSCASHAEDHVSSHDKASRTENSSYDSPDCEAVDLNDESGTFMTEQSKNSHRKLKFQKDFLSDPSLKWSDRRQFTTVSENASLVSRSEIRNFNENFELSSRILSGSNRQLRTSTPKSNSRNGVKYNEKFQCSNNRNVDRYDTHSCSCNQHSEYRAKVDSHVSATRLTREAKPITKLDSALDIAKNVYRVNRYNQTEYLRESGGRAKLKIISGNNPSVRDLLHAKKIWEPMESQKKCQRSNSDSDVTARSCTFQVEGGEPGKKVRSKSEGSSTGGEIDHGNEKMNKSRNLSIPTEDWGSKLPTKVNGPSYPAAGAADDEDGFCNTTNPCLNGTVDPITSINSCSDNCSSCLSEGDSNTASSNHGNLESSSTSDSEETNQQSEGRESSVCIQNSYPDLHNKSMEKTQDTTGRQGLGDGDMSGLPLVGSKVSGMPLTKPPQNHDDGISNVSIGYQHQGIYPPIPSQNVQFPVFPAPTTMNYYHQNPVSWPAASASGLMPFPHPNHYMYPGSLGYGLNGNSGLCMPYGNFSSLATPMYPGPIPVYHPVSKANGLNTEEQTQVAKPETAQEASTLEKGVIPKQCPLEAPANGEGERNDNMSQFQMDNNTSFSLFHFGGPVAFSNGKSNPVPSRDGMSKDFSSQFLADRVENDRPCNKKENIIEEYNLFAASNGLRFSFF